MKADYLLANELNVEVGTSIIEINRIQTANNIHITIAKNYIIEKYVLNIENTNNEIISLYKYLKENYNINITQLKDKISACNVSYEEAQVLGVEPQTALIVVRRICYSNQVPIELDFVKIVASKYEYENYVN